jgi:hypothetical protein
MIAASMAVKCRAGLDFVRASGLAEVQCTVLTPFPGTPRYAGLRREGRLLVERFWYRARSWP